MTSIRSRRIAYVFLSGTVGEDASVFRRVQLDFNQRSSVPWLDCGACVQLSRIILRKVRSSAFSVSPSEIERIESISSPLNCTDSPEVHDSHLIRPPIAFNHPKMGRPVCGVRVLEDTEQRPQSSRTSSCRLRMLMIVSKFRRDSLVN